MTIRQLLDMSKFNGRSCPMYGVYVVVVDSYGGDIEPETDFDYFYEVLLDKYKDYEVKTVDYIIDTIMEDFGYESMLTVAIEVNKR